MAFLVDNIVPITLRIEDVIVFSSPSTLPVARNFTTFDPVLQTHMTMQTAKVMTDYEVSVEVYFTGVGEIRVFGQTVNFNSRVFITETGSINFRPAADSDASLVSPNGSLPVNKVSVIKVGRVGPTGYIYVNEVLISSGPVPTGNSNIAVLGLQGSIYSEGIIANVTLTDLTNPSNSESWKLDRPIGTNTEQSSSGNNLLTYVNATKRELFTKVGNDWLGAERVVNGGFDNGLDGWENTSGAWSWSGGVAVCTNLDLAVKVLRLNNVFTQGLRYQISYTGTVASGGMGMENFAGGIITAGADITPSRESVNVKWTSDNTAATIKRFTTVSSGTLDNVSVKRILETA